MKPTASHLTIVGALIATSAGCSASSDTSGSSATTDASAPIDGSIVSSTLKLAHNDWLSASLNDQVAKILLEEQLGYTVDLVAESSSDQFDAIAAGSVVASLEVWPGGHPDAIAKFIDQQHKILDVGPLGPTARAGWFIPT